MSEREPERTVSHSSGNTAILVIAHGSRQEAANQDLAELVKRLAAKGDYPIVEGCFLELAEPDLPAGGDRCVARGPPSPADSVFPLGRRSPRARPDRCPR